jgi:hypothetical protein
MDGYWTWNMPEEMLKNANTPNPGDVGNLANGDLENSPYLSEDCQVRQVRQTVAHNGLKDGDGDLAPSRIKVHPPGCGCWLCEGEEET